MSLSSDLGELKEIELAPRLPGAPRSAHGRGFLMIPC